MIIRRIVGVLFLTVGLSCCHKHVVKRHMDVPTSFPSSSPAYKPISDLPQTLWWHQFNDLELNHLIDEGLTCNRDIHIAIGNLQEAKGVLKEVNLSWIPTVQLWGGYSTNPALGIPGKFYAAWPYYTLNIMQLYSQNKQATFNLKYYQAAVEGVRLTVIGQIATAYFTLMAQWEQLKLLQQLDNDVNSLIRLSQKDLYIGLGNELSVAQLQSDEQLIRSKFHSIKENITACENALHYFVNENPGHLRNKHNFSQIDFSRIKPGSLPVDVLNNRPDMKMAEYALKAAHANVSVAYSNFFPVMQLDDFVGEVDDPEKKLVDVVDAYGVIHLAASNLGRIAASQGKRTAALAEFQKTVKRILKEVDTDYDSNKQKNQRFLDYKSALHVYQKKYTLQRGLFKTGLISYAELLQSKIYLDNLALDVNMAKLDLALSLVMLYQDLAGGYAHQHVLSNHRSNKNDDSK